MWAYIFDENFAAPLIEMQIPIVLPPPGTEVFFRMTNGMWERYPQGSWIHGTVARVIYGFDGPGAQIRLRNVTATAAPRSEKEFLSSLISATEIERG